MERFNSMDRDALLHYGGGGHYPIAAEPIRIQMPTAAASAVSPLEGEVSSDSTDEKPPRLHIMASNAPMHRGMGDDDSSDSGPFTSADLEENGVTSVHPKSQPAVRYRECLKNHAAALGGYALDGCGEFLPSAKDGLDALKCAACSCHRNFHRKEVEGEYACTCRMNINHSTKLLSGPSTPLLAIQTSGEMLCHGHMTMSMSSPEAERNSGPSSRKRRHRTKFSVEQKKSMMEFAEKLEWKMLRQDDERVQAFCDQVGVPRHVFKVWMHNHKHSMNKRMNAGEMDLFSKCESPPEF